MQKSRASLLFALHQRCFRNRREHIINFILKQLSHICLFFMTQKLVSPVQVSLVLGTKRRKANPSWPKDIVLTRLWKIYLHSEEAAFVTQVINLSRGDIGSTIKTTVYFKSFSDEQFPLLTVKCIYFNINRLKLQNDQKFTLRYL